MPYKIAVLGPIPRDFITTYQNQTITRYGAITHTVIALANLLQNQGKIIPVTHVRKKDFDAIQEIFSPYPCVDMSHIETEHDRGDVIQLKFIDQNNRLEKQSGFMHPIRPSDLEDLLDCDMFVILPVTDFEVGLETLSYLKKNSKGTIIFDAHGPTCTVTPSGDRTLRAWVDVNTWLPYIDILKMNREELESCWYKKEYDWKELVEGRKISLPEAAEYCLSMGVKALYVTADTQGCYAFYMEGGKLKQELVPAVPVSHVVDTTGCGDSFNGGLAFGYLKTKNFIKACQYANACGAFRTQGKDFSVFKSLEETEAVIQQVYGAKK